MIQINSMPDHVHILVGITPDIALSDLVRDIKVSATKFINQKRWVRGQFKWQEGFGAFTYSHSQLGDVVTYIQNQEAHHSCRTFKEEYLELLKRFDVTYNEKYVLIRLIKILPKHDILQHYYASHTAPLERKRSLETFL